MTTKWMAELDVSYVEDIFRLPLSKERKINDAMSAMEESPLRSFVLLIHKVYTRKPGTNI